MSFSKSRQLVTRDMSPGRWIQRAGPLPWFSLALVLLLLAIDDGRVTGLLMQSFLLAATVVLLSLPLGTLLALLLRKTDLPGRSAVTTLCAALILLPLFLHAAAWQAGFGSTGWYTLFFNKSGPMTPLLQGWHAAMWIHAMSSVPWVTLIVAAGLTAAEVRLEEDASLAMPPWRVLRHVTVQAVVPSLGVAALWVAMVVASEMTVTDLFQVRTFAEEIYTQAVLGAFEAEPLFDATSSSLLDLFLRLETLSLWCGTFLIASLGAVALDAGARLIDLGRYDGGECGWRWRLGPWRWAAGLLLLALLLLIAGVPLFNLLHKAGIEITGGQQAWHREWSPEKLLRMLASAPWEHRREIAQTGLLGMAVASGAVSLGTLLVWHGRTMPRTVAIFCIALGLAIPGPLIGLLVIRLLNGPVISEWAVAQLAYDSLLAPWAAQMIRITPVAVLLLAVIFQSIPRVLWEISTVDGASRWSQAVCVVLPLRWRWVLATWLLCFALSAGELPATVLVMPPGDPTLTVQIFGLLHYGVEDKVAAVSIVTTCGFAAMVAVALWLWRARVPP